MRCGWRILSEGTTLDVQPFCSGICKLYISFHSKYFSKAPEKRLLEPSKSNYLSF